MQYSVKFANGSIEERFVYRSSGPKEQYYCYRNYNDWKIAMKVRLREGDPYGDNTDYVEISPEPPLPKSEAFDPSFWYALEMTSIHTTRGYEAVTIICNQTELDQARQVRDNPLVARFMRIVRVNKDKVTEVVV